MKLKKLIEAASSGYPDGLIEQYYNEPETSHGDSLAKFIMVELSETFDEDATDEEQVLAAVHQMRRARAELDSVMSELGGLV